MPEEDEPGLSYEDLIPRSGCQDIQEALEDAKKHGLGVKDLSKETAGEVVRVMASAQAVGGRAGISKK